MAMLADGSGAEQNPDNDISAKSETRRLEWPDIESVIDEETLNECILEHQRHLNEGRYTDDESMQLVLREACARLTSAAERVFRTPKVVGAGELHLPHRDDEKDDKLNVAIQQGDFQGVFCGIHGTIETLIIDEGNGLQTKLSRFQLGYAIDSGIRTFTNDTFGPLERPWWIFVPAETGMCYDEDTYRFERLQQARAEFDEDDPFIAQMDTIIAEDVLDLCRLNQVFISINEQAHTRNHAAEDYLTYLHALTCWERRMANFAACGEGLRIIDQGADSIAVPLLLMGPYKGRFFEFCLEGRSGANCNVDLVLLVELKRSADDMTLVKIPVSVISHFTVEE